MALLKFKAFSKSLKEEKIQKELDKKASDYKKIYLEKLQTYGVTDASHLNDDQLEEFLENMKSYRNKPTIQSEPSDIL
jgi:hypothetical protein